MRILFADQFSEPGGAQLCLRDILSEVKRRGWEPWFAAPGHGELFSFCQRAEIPTFRIPVGRYRNGSKSLWDVTRYAIDIPRSAYLLRRAVRQNRIDLLYVNGPRVLAAAAAVPCPFIFHAHSVPDKNYSKAIVRLALRSRRGRTIAVSQFVAAALPGRADSVPVQVICNGVGDCGYMPRPRMQQVPKIGIIGRISPEKGHIDFVGAARLLLARGFNLRFLVFGAALFSDSKYEATVRAMCAGMPVEFRGWVSDVSAALHEIDVLVVPCSGNEASPRILPEAFSAGTPVVAYPSGGIPEIIKNGYTGLLTEKPACGALASAVATLLADRELAAKVSANGRREWETRFRKERFQTEVADFIERRLYGTP